MDNNGKMINTISIKPKSLVPVMMSIFGGLFIFGVIKGTVMTGFNPILIWLGGIGLIFSISGVFALLNGNNNIINISEFEIDVPTKDGRVKILKTTITMIKKRADLTGRGVIIEYSLDQKLFLNIRKYCSENYFMSLCKRFDYKTEY